MRLMHVLTFHLPGRYICKRIKRKNEAKEGERDKIIKSVPKREFKRSGQRAQEVTSVEILLAGTHTRTD